MKVVAARPRGPFKADERGESSRIVRFLRRIDRLLPRILERCCAGHGKKSLRDRAFAHVEVDVQGGFDAFAFLHHVVPLAALRVSHDLGIAREQQRKEAQAVRMVGDHEEIERAREPRLLAARGRDLLALRKAIGLHRSESSAGCTTIHGERRMQVRVAEERSRWIVSPGVGRVGWLREQLLTSFLVDGVAGILRKNRQGYREQQRQRRCSHWFSRIRRSGA
jgi:hypothetical protein